jgi:hypothetical protein
MRIYKRRGEFAKIKHTESSPTYPTTGSYGYAVCPTAICFNEDMQPLIGTWYVKAKRRPAIQPDANT